MCGSSTSINVCSGIENYIEEKIYLCVIYIFSFFYLKNQMLIYLAIKSLSVVFHQFIFIIKDIFISIDRII